MKWYSRLAPVNGKRVVTGVRVTGTGTGTGAGTAGTGGGGVGFLRTCNR